MRETQNLNEELELQGDQRQPAMLTHGRLTNTSENAISFIKHIINLDGLEGANERKRIINASRKLRKKYLKRQRSEFNFILHVDQMILENTGYIQHHENAYNDDRRDEIESA